MEYYNDIVNEYPLIDAKEEVRLAGIIQSGKNSQEAREKLFNSNIRLIVGLAKNIYNSYNIPFDDLISEGSVGLMNAIDKFDPQKFKTKFSTYAYKCIKLHLNKSIGDFNSRVHVPQNILLKGKKYKELMEKDSEMPRDTIKEILDISEKALVKLENYNAQVVSLDQPISSDDNGSATVGSVIEDTSTENACTNTIAEDEKVVLRTALSILSPLQRNVIKSRWLGEEKQTLSFVGEKFGLSKERVRQIEAIAMEKVRKDITRKNKYHVCR